MKPRKARGSGWPAGEACPARFGAFVCIRRKDHSGKEIMHLAKTSAGVFQWSDEPFERAERERGR